MPQGALGTNGVYIYNPGSFPTQNASASNYWVDVVFNTTMAGDTTAPTVTKFGQAGGGTMVTGGHIVNGRRSASNSAVTRELNGPSCSGPVVGSDVVIRDVKVGDIIIIPPNTVHGWVNIPDHVDYLSFRPSPGVLSAGYVHPSIKK